MFVLFLFGRLYRGVCGWAIELDDMCTDDRVDAVRISPSVHHSDALAYRAMANVDLCWSSDYRACSKCTSHIIVVEVEHSSTSFANFFSLYLAYAIVSAISLLLLETIGRSGFGVYV